MLRISRKASVGLSLVMTVIFFAVIVAGAIIMPALVDTLIETQNNMISRNPVNSSDGRNLVLVVSYLVLAVAAVADVFLFLLLRRVRAGEVFTGRSVALIRGVSWCCILFGLLFAVLGYYFQLALAVGFATLFLGVCLRVVKNVVEQAVELKQENDLTV